MNEVTPEQALKAVQDWYEIERRCSHEVLHKTFEEKNGRVVFRCGCGFVVEGKADRPEGFIADSRKELMLDRATPPKTPSPIDGLTHSSVWGKLNDLQARVERLEYFVNLLSKED